MNDRIAIFGASLAGAWAFRAWEIEYEIVGFIDNDPDKQGSMYLGKPVYAPEDALRQNIDRIVIASSYSPEIFSQLNALNWPESKVSIDHSPADLGMRSQWDGEHSSRLEAFRSKHQGEDCFILGNGPSLNRMDLSPLNKYYTFGLNKIHLLFSKNAFRPSYHVAINPLVVDQSWIAFNKLDCPSFISFETARDKIAPAPNIHFIHTTHSQGFSEDAMNTICEGSTVTYAALQLAYFMGFKSVYLIGVDHSFQSTGSPNETQTMGASDPNHFDPAYFANQPWQLPDLEGSEFSYRMAKRAYEMRKPPAKIYDGTLDGKLSVFPKIGYEQALDACKKRGGAE